MEIITYRELEPKDEFMVLMELGFWSPLSPTKFEELIDLDLRLKNGPVGFCAVENGRLAGFVGVMDIPTRTVDGSEETVGGIYDVATNPMFAKRGICKVLMDGAHQYFEEKKYNFSFLLTLRTIIAYAFYKKLNYIEIEKYNQFPIAYKVMRKDKEQKKYDMKFFPKKIEEIYRKYIREKTGFTQRQKDFIKLFMQWGFSDLKKSFYQENGYALLTEIRSTIKIKELVSLDDQTYDKMLERIESTAQAGVIDRLVNDERLLKIYKSRGYRIQEGDHAVFMVKKMGDFEFEEIYGDNFHIGAMDLF